MAGKVPRKPLELLKALLTSRHGLDVEAAMDLLWPELEGDAARDAFDIAAHRLRKLLKCNDSVLANQGRLTLNPDRVWVDVFELMRLQDLSFAEEDNAALGRVALQLYRAPLLNPWDCRGARSGARCVPAHREEADRQARGGGSVERDQTIL
jgi:DNA-binding SARP family transcriptional activator